MKCTSYIKKNKHSCLPYKIICLLLTFGITLSGCATKEFPAPVTNENSLPTVCVSTEENYLYKDPSLPIDERVENLLSLMTLEEKVGQMVQGEQNYLDAKTVTKLGLGSVLSGGGCAPSTGNTIEDWEARVNELKQAALESRLGIPLIYGVDSVHGNNNVYGATIFPHNIGLGVANNPKLMTKLGELSASETKAAGIQWIFAPTIGNPQNTSWGRSYECFSEKAEDIGELAAAYIKGFQGDISDTNSYMESKHTVACAKHFIGEGYTTDGINQGNVEMTNAEFDELLHSGVLDPYTKAVNADVLTVMISYNSVNGVKCHENKHLITDILKGELGFKGFTIGDYNGVEQVSGSSYYEQVANCVNAGLDMLMEPSNYEDAVKTILKCVDKGMISEERIDDAVSRILWVKFKAGLFEEKIASDTEKELIANFGSDEHREVARQAVRESLVLLKNDNDALSKLKNANNIDVTGQLANDLGSQCGGWTISWQGQPGTAITVGTTIGKGIAMAAPDKTVLYNKNGDITKNADAVIAVFGERPYAETDGDLAGHMAKIPSSDAKVLDQIKTSTANTNRDIPIIGVIVSGRPIDLTDYEDMFDAIIMAWLPGTEGEGIADLLLGDYDFTGTLKYTWPKEFDDSKFITEYTDDQILYPYGHGLKK